MFTHLIVGAAGFNIGDALFYAILFIILMWVVKIFAWKPVTKMMQNRADKIAKDIDTAEKSRNEAVELAKKREEALVHSQEEANEIINKAQQTGDKRRESIISEAQADVKNIKENAEKDIEQQKRDALASIKNDVADLSIEIASKIIKKNLDANNQKALIDSYIEGLGNNESK
ncbi:ATP synthase F0 subunit B [Fructilactobacillus lindneri]|uniref:ATP synthase subunit b n=2 Tax=Fructilactobacillus lindneri TaxID=53444 RepID=A0A0R2JQ28_9LACO|nr:F0F1 ATP synthase subunit B [Fructilactobacillus lindneri]ANZ58372.1 F0F1 ATP synthase subunit B [Fructilactobacillus lindneri]ANZ59694.1 F0F1 ATP synthase subunit B [Fructilactobacillus lindneri]KRN79208.1 ATP synthase subunit b [Fructilactobacillus lindneri DSM 20690 = JCM 11027]POG98523.1 ATP synthase F0 subunit B [Fructilactobacillus lindneri]POH03911.1 ATP synthase F0 subunit B [Fructilactobacillus lindneri]